MEIRPDDPYSEEGLGIGTTVRVRIYEPTEELKTEESVILQTDERKEIKNELKRLLYRVLSAHNQPTAPMGEPDRNQADKDSNGTSGAGMENPDIASYMRNTYYTSNEKTALAIAIANRERHLLKDINYENGYSLYVGIPFCPSICLYCSFSSSPIGIWKDQVDAYLDALCKEIDYASEAFADKELNTVYIGGGTPTTLEPVQLDRLLTKLEERFDYSRLREFTVEAGRPDSITAKSCRYCGIMASAASLSTRRR